MNSRLLEILRCPMHPDGPKLELRGSLLICQVDGVGFRIIDDIPDMLPENAVPAEQVRKEIEGIESATE